MGFPPVPPEIKSVAHVLKVADEHDNRNIVVSYWARMHACQSAMKLIPGKKPPEVSKLLIALMDWLEETKKNHHDTEGITNETVAQAEIEQYCLQLFAFADREDRAEHFNKNVIKAFYTAGILMDVLEQFGELSEDIQYKRKYAKWKAAYIHTCLKNGEEPMAGGPDEHLKNVIDLRETEGYDDQTENTGNDNKKEDNIKSPESPNSADVNSNTSSGNGDGNFPTGPAPASSPVTPGTALSPEAYIPVMPPQSYIPIISPQVVPATVVQPASSDSPITEPEVIQKAQKFCKYATSALNYDDVKTAVENLNKALNLLQMGRED